MKRTAMPQPKAVQVDLFDAQAEPRAARIDTPIAPLPSSVGTLPRDAYVVYCTLSHHGPLTRGALVNVLAREQDWVARTIDQAIGRLTRTPYVSVVLQDTPEQLYTAVRT